MGLHSFGIQRPSYEDPSVIETLDVCRFLFGTQDGQMVQTGEMKISAHEKSKLVGVLTSWLGSNPGAGFDTESLRGKGCMINIIQKTSQKGTVYSDITSISPVMQGMEAQVPQAASFNIPGGACAPAPQATTQVTIDQPQVVQPAPVQVPVQVAQPVSQQATFTAPATSTVQPPF
jgi:excinuclease UvrABC ATPase subunit